MVLNKIHQVQRKQTDSHRLSSKSPPLARKQVRVIGQLRHQSATAPSHATHAVDAVAAHRSHELWSHTHVTE